MKKDGSDAASQQGVSISKRGLIVGVAAGAALGAGAMLAAQIWVRKDMAARLFNPFQLGDFELAGVPGLKRADGSAMPGFSSADLAGRRSILNFWASWCPPCREEHALLVDLAARDIAPIFGANVKDEPEHAREFLSRRGNPYRAVGADSHAYLQRALGARGVPATYVIAPGPVVELSILGPLDREAIEERIVPALKSAASRDTEAHSRKG
ncbi:redoxin family protein [Methylocystis heyeri]|uniref:Redoxin family protein n=1 Tax=Methylocystis heyeri TaxID=391905 RepID=A0A6B8KBR0_9HYPH|nr:redoxin family protein [Methylocystis heyeri]QGM44992.1 redoxin family protein [Methylocystis heyeri]